MGCGSVADFGHVPAILQTPGLELAAIYDPDPARIAIFQEKFGIAQGFVEVEPFLAMGLDAVVIASPPFAHLSNAIAAAAAGAQILCEKPLADNEADSAALVAAVESAGKQLYTGFVYRFSPVAEQIRQWIQEAIVGEIRSLRLIYDWNLHGQYQSDAAGHWSLNPLWTGRMREGGPLVDCGVHQIDLARWWLESEVIQFGAYGAWVVEYEAPDQVYLHMTHANEAVTTIEVSFTYGHTAREPRSIFTYELIGTGGVICYDRDGYLLEARHGQGTTTVPGASEKNFPGMYQALLTALEGGPPGALASGEDGIIATRIAEQATQLAIEGRIRSVTRKP